MSEHGPISSEAMIGAAAALHVLRAILPDEAIVRHDQVILLPDGTVRTGEAAATVLAGLAKPLECRATADEGRMVVASGTVSEENRWLYEEYLSVLEADGGLVGAEGLDAVRRAASDAVLLVGREGESMLLRLAELQRFERDYLILGHYFAFSDPPDEAQKAKGAAYVVQFAASQSTTRPVSRRR